MKRYKLLTQEGYEYYKKGEIYEGNSHLDDSITVSRFADIYPDDWEEIVEEVETDEEVVNKLVDIYWFSEEDAKNLIEEYAKIQTMTIYEMATLISIFK